MRFKSLVLQTNVQLKVVVAIFSVTILLFRYSLAHNFYLDTFKDQKELIKVVCDRDEAATEEVCKILEQVDRGRYYVQNLTADSPYSDFPLNIGFCSMICAPHLHAYILEELKAQLKEGNKVLDIGSGSGYLSVCMALMVGKTGRVIGIEHLPELVDLATSNVINDRPELLTSGRVKFICADGRQGLVNEGPFDVIYIGGALIDEPTEIYDQLKNGGRLLVPLGQPEYTQQLVIVNKDIEGDVKKYSDLIVFMPFLSDKETQYKREFNPVDFYGGVRYS